MRRRGACLHVKEGCSSVGPADVEQVALAALLDGQQDHDAAEHGPPADAEARLIVGGRALVVQLPEGCLPVNAAVSHQVSPQGLQTCVVVGPDHLQSQWFRQAVRQTTYARA